MGIVKMDSQDYLDQISKTSRPVKPQKNGLTRAIKSKYFIWGAVALGILIVVIAIGSILGGGTTTEDECADLVLRLEETNELAISKYQPFLKSSILRSLSASLGGIYTNTSTELNNYMTQAFPSTKDKTIEAKREEAILNATALADELFKAKINGLLDRTYAHKMTLEIYSVMSDEMSIYNATNDTALRGLLKSSYDSLNNLYTEFNDFSETSK